jgi:putative ABC transport system permease protein
MIRSFTKRLSLLRETAEMALDTLWANKLRSALTVLGVIIGITSIVSMTALIRGFDQDLRSTIMALGPKTIFVQRFGALSFSSGSSFLELLRRPTLTADDGEAIRRLAPTVAKVDTWLGAGPPQPTMERIFYQNERTSPQAVMGASERFADVNFAKMLLGRSVNEQDVARGRAVVVLGYGAYEALFLKNGIDPVNKQVRVGARRYTVIGVFDKRPGMLGSNDELVMVPYTAWRKHFGSERTRSGPFGGAPAMIAIVPHDWATRDEAMREVEAIMRIRHDLTLDKPNDFDLVTQDAILKIWEQISQAVLLSLVVISSIALMVGGIGVMSIMTISVTERTREIGVRKAIGARRTEILFQFLIEAVVLTSIGGVLGILIGSSIGLAVNVVAGFPISMPWWSFALGLGFSAGVGIFFGMLPAWRASRLDPIEALRYE